MVPEDATAITLEATLPFESPLDLDIEPGLPLASRCPDAENLTLHLERGEQSAAGAASISWPIAGTHEFDRATCRVSTGLFTEAIPIGEAPAVRVQAGAPRRIHVGKGGDRVPPHTAPTTQGIGSGLEPVELRKYHPGDTIDRIDWKATARLATPHVRKYEAQTDRTILIVMDARPSLDQGPPGETKFAYLREVALTVVANANSLEDPIGLIAVDEAGIRTSLQPTGSPRRYATIRRLLLDMEPTASDSIDTGPITSGVSIGSEPVSLQPTDTFGRTLGPFVANRETAWQVETDPLVRGMRTGISKLSSPLWTLICTDDSNPREVREAVQAARQRAGHVVVLLAPSVLYERGALGDVQSAYDRYLTFERFRQDIDGMSQVTALQVAPGDRLATVLSTDSRREVGTA
ncbi:MAG: DUF58 domain-containing protein [Natrialbaceae archaeon]|nr:DUF58 domain-containing protein [Natrialbaceae archaeon]